LIAILSFVIGGLVVRWLFPRQRSFQVHIGPIEVLRDVPGNDDTIGWIVGLGCGVEYWLLEGKQDYPVVLRDCRLRFDTKETQPATHAAAMAFLEQKKSAHGWGDARKFKLEKSRCTCPHEIRSFDRYDIRQGTQPAGTLLVHTVQPEKLYLEDLAGSNLSFPFQVDVESKAGSPTVGTAAPSTKAHWLTRDPW